VPIRVAAIVGTGGVGKTALAVRWAHRVRDRFPDGQLYVNLRAHAAEGPLRPIEALTGFLLALGTPADRVPGDEDQAAALYRSRLAGRRVLVVLDNAASAEQVRPLLPAAPGSLVVVTGRDRMAGLIARDGARLVTLDVLAPDQAVTLLGQILGTTRIAAEPAATAELARLCAHLPLALRIAAANLAGRPRHPIADYVAKLVGGDRLGALAIDGDAATAVRATFEASCDALPAAERRLFRLLGLAPGPDITARSAAALAQTSPGAGVDADEAERLLDRLTSRHLVDEHLPGRYSMHDLLRLHAAELADAEEDDTSRAAALRALARHYYADLVTASQLLYPHLLHLPEPENTCAAADDGAGDGARVRFPDGPAAMSWIDAERANLVALIGRLGQQGHHSEVWRLADRLNGYFVLQKNSVDWQNVAEAAHASALADGDLTAQAGAELHLGMADDALGRIDSAATHYTCSAELSRQAGWTACQAVAINNLARHSWLSARVDETIARLTSALVLHRESGRKAGEAVTLANLATAHQERARELEDASEPSEHDRAEARRLFAEALNLHREIGDRRNEGDTLRLLAEVNRDSGDHLRALRQTEQALRIVRGDGDRRFEVYALSTLATIRAIHGENESALNGHAEAVRLARELGDPRVQTQILLDLAQTHARLGRPDDALVPLREAVALARQIGSWLLERQARRIERLVQAADPVRPVSDSADPLSRRDPAVLV
jgi:tetratricopeptide (TPR) repeat protein